MPKEHPPEFRQRAFDLIWMREKPVAQIASDLGIPESCLLRWLGLADVEDGHKPGLNADEQAELVPLRREKRNLETEIGILKRASAYFTQENILPK